MKTSWQIESGGLLCRWSALLDDGSNSPIMPATSTERYGSFMPPMPDFVVRSLEPPVEPTSVFINALDIAVCHSSDTCDGRSRDSAKPLDQADSSNSSLSISRSCRKRTRRSFSFSATLSEIQARLTWPVVSIRRSHCRSASHSLIRDLVCSICILRLRFTHPPSSRRQTVGCFDRTVRCLCNPARPAERTRQ